METITEEIAINYPEGVDEAQFSMLVKNVLDCIDRVKLLADARLTRVRHPLLQEEIGADVALNTEILNMLEDIASIISLEAGSQRQIELSTRLEYVERILLEAAVDSKKFGEALLTLVETLDQLNKSNPHEEGLAMAPGLLEHELRKQLKLPTLAQDYVLYPPVTTHSLGGNREEVLGNLEACREDLAGRVINEPNAAELIAEIEGIASRAKAWFEQNIEIQ